MKIKVITKIALKNLWSYKARTALTVSGVTIGIGAIIFLVSLGYGLENLVTSQVTTLDAFTTIDVPNTTVGNQRADQEVVNKVLAINQVVTVGTAINVPGRLKLNTDSSTAEVVVLAANEDYWGIANITGINSIPKDTTSVYLNDSAVKVMQESNDSIVGKTVYLDAIIQSDLAANNDAGTVFAENLPLVVKGIIAGDGSPIIYIHQDLLLNHGAHRFSALKVKVSDSKNVPVVRAAMESMGLTTEYIGDTVQEIQAVFNLFRASLAAFGLIALVVAALGTFNTLTISLLERTREVGLFKALGMDNKSIYKLFISEALIIGVLGGIIGLIIGGSLAEIINWVLKVLAIRAGAEPLNIFVTPWSFALLVAAFSVFVGFITGWYPARRAVKINPLDALRYE